MIRILFVDDEGFFARPYIEKLEKTFDVHFCDSADEALQRINSDNKLKVVVLDIMMPCPTGIAATVTSDGLSTGLWMLKQIRELMVGRGLPVVILTNRMLNAVQEGVDQLDLPEGLVEILPKSQTPNFLLPSKVQKMVDKWTQRSEN